MISAFSLYIHVGARWIFPLKVFRRTQDRGPKHCAGGSAPAQPDKRCSVQNGWGCPLKRKQSTVQVGNGKCAKWSKNTPRGPTDGTLKIENWIKIQWNGILQLVSRASWALLTPSACDCCKDPYFKGLVAFWNWSTRHGARVVTCHPIPQVSSRTNWNWQSRSFSMVLVAASSNSRFLFTILYSPNFSAANIS